MTFEEFYRKFGLENYPFNIFTTEDEEKAEQLFIEPMDYELVKDSFFKNRTIIMVGNRGTGKTALMYDLLRKSNKDTFVCYIEDYSGIIEKSTLEEYYYCIIKNIVNALVCHITDKEKEIQKSSKEDKVFLSYLVSKFTDQLTKERLNEKVEQIQISPIRRFLKKHATFLKFVINYGLTAAIRVFKNTFAINTSLLVDINEDQVKELLPNWKYNLEDNFIDVGVSYAFLIKVVGLLKKLGYQKVNIFFDKLDEDGRMINDAEIIADFIKPLLMDTKLLLNSELQLVVSVWLVPFRIIKEDIRTQKYYCPEIIWEDMDLIKAFNQRMIVFSQDKAREFDEFFSENVDSATKKLILFMANRNPRDLWHIFNAMFKAQYKLNSNSVVIEKDAVINGISNFVEKFNYFEYYPKSKNASARSMNIYSYIKHLLKLSSDKFTANQLNSEAGTGSSSQGYINGMQKLGVIRRIDEKRSGGVVYEIADPKVSYARKYKLSIER